jgi:hypothetical protein
MLKFCPEYPGKKLPKDANEKKYTVFLDFSILNLWHLIIRLYGGLQFGTDEGFFTVYNILKSMLMAKGALKGQKMFVLHVQPCWMLLKKYKRQPAV